MEMKAKMVYEFVRGRDPKDTLKIGKYSNLVERIKKMIIDSWNHFNETDEIKYI